MSNVIIAARTTATSNSRREKNAFLTSAIDPYFTDHKIRTKKIQRKTLDQKLSPKILNHHQIRIGIELRQRFRFLIANFRTLHLGRKKILVRFHDNFTRPARRKPIPDFHRFSFQFLIILEKIPGNFKEHRIDILQIANRMRNIKRLRVLQPSMNGNRMNPTRQLMMVLIK